jgi:uncharacterized protein DUF4157/putative RNase toxin 4 of polymorphic toxin system
MFTRAPLTKQAAAPKAGPPVKQAPDYFASDEAIGHLSPEYAYSLSAMRSFGSGQADPDPAGSAFSKGLTLQPKLIVGRSDDPFESEADRIANAVVGMSPAGRQRPAISAVAPAAQRKCACGGTCEKCASQRSEDEETIRRKASGASGHARMTAPPAVHQALRAPGMALDTKTMNYMQPRFGRDLSGVRIHTDGSAADSARRIHARAFTVGNQIVFGSGQYAPDTAEGRRLIAHELTHTIQQGGTNTRQVQRSPWSQSKETAQERSQESSAEQMQAAKAREQVERGWRLPEMERDLLHSQFKSTEERRWYLKHFLDHHYVYYTGEHLDPDTLKQNMVFYERRYQQSRSKEEVLQIPRSAGSTSWLDEEIKTPEQKEKERLLDEQRKRAQQDQDTRNVLAYTEFLRVSEKGDFKARIDQVQYQLRKSREDPKISELEWPAKESISEADDVWKYGIANDLFAPSERQSVYGYMSDLAVSTYSKRFELAYRGAYSWKVVDEPGLKYFVQRLTDQDIAAYASQRSLLLRREYARISTDRKPFDENINSKAEEQIAAERRKFESDQYQAWTAQGDALSSPEPVLQGFAVAAFGEIPAAIYGGIQTGQMIGESYNACVKGEGDCSTAVFQAGTAVATHFATRAIAKGTSEHPVDSSPANPVDSSLSKGDNPATSSQSKPAGATAKDADIATSKTTVQTEPSKPHPTATPEKKVSGSGQQNQGHDASVTAAKAKDSTAPGKSASKPMRRLPKGERRGTVNVTDKTQRSNQKPNPEVTHGSGHSDEIEPEYSATPDGKGKARTRRPGKILREFRAPDGIAIDMEIGDSVARLGLEDTLPTGTEVNLEGWQRAHQGAPGLGAESETGIRYAPPELNLGYQNAGIERFIREFNTQKAMDVHLNLRSVVETHPGSLRLKSVTYQLSAERQQVQTRLFEVKIEVENATTNPKITVEDPEIFGDWKTFLR